VPRVQFSTISQDAAGGGEGQRWDGLGCDWTGRAAGARRSIPAGSEKCRAAVKVWWSAAAVTQQEMPIGSLRFEGAAGKRYMPGREHGELSAKPRHAAATT
jgi:hypothetical protein